MCREIKNYHDNAVALLLGGSDPREINQGEKSNLYVSWFCFFFLGGNMDVSVPLCNSLTESQDCIELRIFLSNEK